MKKILKKIKKLSVWLPPFFLTLFPTLVVYQHNIDQLEPSRLFIPLLYSTIFMVISCCLAFVLFRKNDKASIFASVWIFLFFSFGYIYLKLGEVSFITSLPISVNKLLLGLYGVGFCILGWWLFRTRKKLDSLMTMLLLISGVLIIMNLVSILPFEISRALAAQKLHTYIVNNLKTTQVNQNVTFKPDIYYIIFDRYGRQDVLSTYLNFNNKKNSDFLKSKGFLIGENSYANYPNTFLSFSSALNMTYLDFLTQVMGENQRDRASVFKQLIEDNYVARFLQAQGYHYILAGSFWDPTKVSGISDENENLFSDFDEFHLYIYERTLLNTFRGIVENKQLYTGVERLNKMDLNLDYRMAQIKQKNGLPQPLFVMAHFLMPHEPNVRAADCEPLTFDQIRDQSAIEGYLKETECANQVMQKLVAEIQSSERPAVIIFQSDEGPYLPVQYFDPNGEIIPDTREAYFIHGAILNMIYMPQKDNPSKPVEYAKVGLDVNSSPVNTFRAVFNYYFSTNFPILENKTYFFTEQQYPYRFKDVTSYYTSDQGKK